jgi:ABC-type lipoprotein release transport system permease subunit
MVAAAGVVVGGATAVIAGHAVQALLFETAPSDPFVLGSAAALMLAVAAGATLIPARAASKADPGSLLKTL